MGKVSEIKERELGYQPVASDEELAEAAKILKHQLPAFAATIEPESLRGLAQSGVNGRREIYVFGSSPDQKKSAVVDLYSKKVLNANAVMKIE
jgi:hypothetical protein